MYWCVEYATHEATTYCKMVLSKLKSWLFGDEKERKKSSDKDVAFGHSSEDKVCEFGAKEKAVAPARIHSPKSFSAGLLERGGVTKLRVPRYGYKATRNGIIRLIIPEGAKVVVPVMPTNRGLDRKLRASKVYVDKIVPVVGKGSRRTGSAPLDNMLRNMAAQSMHDPTYTYKQDEFHEPDEFDDNPVHTCSNGLHFFHRPRGAKKWFVRNNPNHVTITDRELNQAERRVQV